MGPLLAIASETFVVLIFIGVYLIALAASLTFMASALRTTQMNVAFALLFGLQSSLFFGFVSFCLTLPI